MVASREDSKKYNAYFLQRIDQGRCFLGSSTALISSCRRLGHTVRRIQSDTEVDHRIFSLAILDTYPPKSSFCNQICICNDSQSKQCCSCRDNRDQSNNLIPTLKSRPRKIIVVKTDLYPGIPAVVYLSASSELKNSLKYRQVFR